MANANPGNRSQESESGNSIESNGEGMIGSSKRRGGILERTKLCESCGDAYARLATSSGVDGKNVDSVHSGVGGMCVPTGMLTL